MSIERICIVEFHRPNIKLPTFSELIGALMNALNHAGIPTSYRQNEIDDKALNIVFGAHRVFQSHEGVCDFPDDCSFFNLEALYEDHASQAHHRYLELMKKSRVIDYSPRNCDVLARAGNARVFRFRFGYTPLTHLAFPSRQSHFLFYGVPTDRRRQVIERLVAAGTPVRGIAGVWGFERDYEVATSRAVVNISKFDDSVLEIYRLWHSLCLGTPVISEKGIDARLVDEWRAHVHFVDRMQTITDDDLLLLPDALLYRQTSFQRETVKLLEWLSSGRN
jgi:hypothetical protein